MTGATEFDELAFALGVWREGAFVAQDGTVRLRVNSLGACVIELAGGCTNRTSWQSGDTEMNRNYS